MSDEPVMDFRAQVLLSVQRALWDRVPAHLRAVAARSIYPCVGVRLIFETVGDFEREITSYVEAEVGSDFLPPVDVECIAVATPPAHGRELGPDEFWVFLRMEP